MLAKSYPRIPMYRSWQGIACQVRGQFLAEDGRLAEARSELEKSRSLLEVLVKEHPDQPSYRGTFGKTCIELGRLARRAGDKTSAGAWFARADEALGKAATQSPDSADVRRSLEELRGE